MPTERKVTASRDQDSRPALDPSRWLERYGDFLFRYAMIRTGRQEVAEDLVQETLLAALRARDRFGGQSSEQTWLVGILARKVADYFRAQSRQRVVESNEQREAFPETEFTERGFWIARVGRWPNEPAQALESQEFWAAFANCLSKLEPSLLAAFSLREFDQLSTEDICKTLNITPTNVGVRLYRARAFLRKCLEANWFED